MLLAIACLAGLVAGVASMRAGETILGRYRGDLVQAITTHPKPEDMQRWRNARLYSAVWTFTTMGGCLAVAMGLAGGLARRSALAAGSAAIAGLVLGTATAGGLAYILVANFYKHHDPQSNDLVLPLLTHCAIWSAAGAIGGLAFGLGLGGRGRWKATVMGGLAGAAAATIVYELAGALAFASSKTDLPLSDSSITRGMAQLLTATFAAAGAVLALPQASKPDKGQTVGGGPATGVEEIGG
jgi:hypothetical protein